MIYAATTERSIAMVLLAVVVVGWAIYVFVNIRRSKSEVGSEIELAANRGSLPDDEVLEGSRLEQVQAFGVLMLLIIALVLPCLLYTSHAADDTPCVDLGGRRFI